LSRRLGDDPLVRARAERAKAAEVPASAALDAGGQQGTAQVGVHASRPSYNDVFFQRRGDEVPTPRAAEVKAPDAPEISEISEIPEIREVAAAAGGQTAFDSTPAAEPTVAKGAEVVQADRVSTVEEAAASSNSQAAVAAPAAAPPPEVEAEHASPSTASQAQPIEANEPEPQKSGGFLKRLFGKFK
jgi:hypothetical protein